MIVLKLESQAKTDKNVLAAKRALDALLAREDLGFHSLPSKDSLWESSRLRGEEVASKYSKLVVFGIGGSSLGGRALQCALGGKSKRRVIFCENVDPVSFWKTLESLESLEKTHFAVISKSGTTLETLSQMQFANEYLSQNGIQLSQNCTVITEKKENPLRQWASENGCHALEIPEDVGGRFSVLSPVGLFPASFMGLDLRALQQGAQFAVENRELVINLAHETSQSFERGEWVTYLWTYSDRLKDFGSWVQQLWAESLAKEINRKGTSAPRASVPIPLVGAVDQHSVLQQVMEGDKGRSVWFLSDDEKERSGLKLNHSLFDQTKYLEGKSLGDVLHAELEATKLALHNSGCSVLHLRTERLDEFHMGHLFMTFQLLIGTLGELLDINAFDQPGVESGKKLARSILMD